jgi:P4 family phage/plasmid primase-like protien
MTTAAHISGLYDLLGESAVLLPVPSEQKGPRFSGWQKVTLAATAADEYQDKLTTGNVGVLLGEPSSGLCAIDIDEDALMEEFFKLNPALRNTLITRGARGVQVWVRCMHDPKAGRRGLPSYPKLYPLAYRKGERDVEDPATGNTVPSHFGEWRSTGGQSIVHGIHPSGCEYTRVNAARVREVIFSSIRWPDGLVLPWSAEVGQALIQKYGLPYTEKNGEPHSMIETYWAGLFAAEYDVIYDKDEERYFLYDESRGIWERASEQDIIYLGTEMLLRASRAQNQPVLQSHKFRSAAKMSAISTHLKGIVGTRNIFKNKRGLIHLKNGMLDLTDIDDNGALRLMPFAPDYYSRNQIPVAFDGSATSPRFLNDLLGAGLGPDEVKLMQRWGGMLLLQENVYQKIMILTGTAGGGKSTVMTVFQKMVGQDNCAQLRTEQLLERFEMAAFIGKSTLIGADVPGNFLQQRGSYKLKQLTGGDFFQAEIKTARDLVTLYGNFNVGITCNSRLRVAMDSDSGAWNRRLCIIKYEAPKPENPIDNFAQWLVDNEGPGILNWLIEGAVELLESGKFEMTAAQKTVVTDLLEESDSIRSFLRRCVTRAGRESDVTTEELIEAYHAFCDSRGWDAAPAGSLEKHFPNVMLEMFRLNKTNNLKREGTARRGYTRVKLLDLEDESTTYDGGMD